MPNWSWESWPTHTKNSVWSWKLSFYQTSWWQSWFTGQHFHWRRDVGAPFCPRNQGRKHGMERACFSKKEVYKCPLCQKNLVIFFRNMKLAVLECYQEWEQTVTSATYSDMLKDKVKPAIPNRRWELLSKTVRLLHVDTWPTSQPQKREFEIWSLSICHIYLTVPTSHCATFMSSVRLKGHYAGRQFSSDEEVNEAVRMWITMESGKLWTMLKNSVTVV